MSVDIDYAKDFDKVSHRMLKLETYGIKGKLWRGLRHIWRTEINEWL